MADFYLTTFERLHETWDRIYHTANSGMIFSSPWWSQIWFDHFMDDNQLLLGAILEKNETVGIAPLRVENNVARFIGSNDVCDFLDFIIEPGKENLFFQTLIDELKKKNINALDLSPLLPESTVMKFLADLSTGPGFKTTVNQDDSIVELSLPSSLPEYLSLLSSKQRHELLRKERRMSEEGDVAFRQHENDNPEYTDTFLRFFIESRNDKKAFLTPKMESFFRSIIRKAAEKGVLKLGTLELNSLPIAATLCFDYRNDIYLYNSGYDPQYKWLSAGVISKYYCIKNSIERGKANFNFLKGAEKYKFHLGGKEVPLYRCIINL